MAQQASRSAPDDAPTPNATAAGEQVAATIVQTLVRGRQGRQRGKRAAKQRTSRDRREPTAPTARPVLPREAIDQIAADLLADDIPYTYDQLKHKSREQVAAFFEAGGVLTDDDVGGAATRAAPPSSSSEPVTGAAPPPAPSPEHVAATRLQAQARGNLSRGRDLPWHNTRAGTLARRLNEQVERTG